jgi:hypothetical protein
LGEMDHVYGNVAPPVRLTRRAEYDLVLKGAGESSR